MHSESVNILDVKLAFLYQVTESWEGVYISTYV